MHTRSPIKDFLIDHAKRKSVSFHMPGHKGSDIYERFGHGDFLSDFMNCDVTEIAGADNLFQAEGIIREVEDSYSSLYDVKKSYLLINGTSGGIIAACLASVPRGGKMVMARNCHKSVFNALTLGNIQPLYAYPELNAEFGILGAIPPAEIERLLTDNPDASAVILPSPNYYGICSDIDAIAKIVHKHDKILIVDQAHGAHLKLFGKFGIKGFPKSSEECGADITINSIHKTLASFTQSAVLNLNSERIPRYMLEDKLQAIESTSPSYILMASLDINSRLILEHGKELMHNWHDNLNYFYDNAKAIENLKLIQRDSDIDWTKINLSFEEIGISGVELEKLLRENNIFIELFTKDLAMCMSGIGNTKKDMDHLLRVLRTISSSRPRQLTNHAPTMPSKENSTFKYKNVKIYDIPNDKVKVPLLDAEGMICALSVIPYPPGIPLVCPGEKFDKDTITYLKELWDRNEKVIGLSETCEVVVGLE